ncbi:MAG: DUF6621 family protein [Alloprevotella sp.]|nr:DUF6621 family protein [Alloprevotella sp.]
MQNKPWAPNVVLVDADFLDALAFDFTVNFERMLERRIPKADLCHWIDCVSLDGGLERGQNEVQVHFLHSKDKGEMKYFRLSKSHDESAPLRFGEDINNQRFEDALGRFDLFAFPTEKIVGIDELFLQSASMLLQAEGIGRLLLVGNMEAYGTTLKRLCTEAKGKEVTLFTMQPEMGRGFQQQILGYSLMAALGIKGEELR